MIYHQYFDTFGNNMAKQVKPEITEEKLGDNPFLDTLKIPVARITMHGQYKSDADGLLLPVEVDMEKDSYCRVYTDSKRRLAMAGLTPRANDLLLWIIFEVENSSEVIWINKVRYMKERRIKAYNTYKDALTELLKSKFLLPSVIQNVYWINPHFFFNGSRINRFPKNVVRK